jgi:DNA-binding transcriptional LysR family regulator
MPDCSSIHELYIALCAHACGSFRGAATELGINHATVSRRITDLEDRMGITLFDRRGHHVVATDAALRLLTDVEPHFAHIQSAIGAASQRTDTRWVTLSSTTYQLFPEVTSKLPHIAGLEHRVLPARPIEAEIGFVFNGRLRSIDAFHVPIGAITWGVYAHRTLRYDICKQRLFKTLDGPPIDQLALAEFGPSITLETVDMVVNAIESEAGLGLLPRHYGNQSRDLIEVHGEHEGWISQCGLSCGHDEDIRNLTQRIAEQLNVTPEPVPTNVYSMHPPRTGRPQQLPKQDLARPDHRDNAQ